MHRILTWSSGGLLFLFSFTVISQSFGWVFASLPRHPLNMELGKLHLTFRRPRLRDGPLLFCFEGTSFEAASTLGHCCFVFVCVVCGLLGCCPLHRPAPLHGFSQLSPAFCSNP